MSHKPDVYGGRTLISPSNLPPVVSLLFSHFKFSIFSLA